MYYDAYTQFGNKNINNDQFCVVTIFNFFFTAKDVKNWITQKKIKILPDWPSQSPDLNPIEHLWHELEWRLRKRSVHPKNFYDLEEALQEE